MKVLVVPYDLPDIQLFKEASDGFLIVQPKEYFLVLGQSNTAEKSLHTDAVIRDGIHVTKRPTGGEAVMLTPKTLVITVARSFQAMIPFRDFFSMVNRTIMDCLSEMGVTGLSSRGISDITIGARKILGSSMRNTSNRLVYHAVLNVAEDPELFEKYLRHPVREPEYRAGRSHREFVTSLLAEGYSLTPDKLAAALNGKLSGFRAEMPEANSEHLKISHG
jgi:lipoate-protein ligase A